MDSVVKHPRLPVWPAARHRAEIDVLGPVLDRFRMVFEGGAGISGLVWRGLHPPRPRGLAKLGGQVGGSLWGPCVPHDPAREPDRASLF